MTTSRSWTSPDDLGIGPVIPHKCSTCKQPMDCYHVLYYNPERRPDDLEGLVRCNNPRCRDTGWYTQMRLEFVKASPPDLFSSTTVASGPPELFGGMNDE